MKNLKLFALLCAMAIFVVSCGEETVTNTETKAPTIEIPEGNWTPAELELIKEYGGIKTFDIEGNNSPKLSIVPGPNDKYMRVWVGFPDASGCIGSERWCYTQEVEFNPLVSDATKLIVRVVVMNVIKCIVSTQESIPGLSANGLLAIQDPIFAGSITIEAGLYQIDPETPYEILVEGTID